VVRKSSSPSFTRLWRDKEGIISNEPIFYPPPFPAKLAKEGGYENHSRLAPCFSIKKPASASRYNILQSQNNANEKA